MSRVALLAASVVLSAHARAWAQTPPADSTTPAAPAEQNGSSTTTPPAEPPSSVAETAAEAEVTQTLTPEQRRTLIPAPGETVPQVDGREHRVVVPPFYVHEWGRDYSTRVLFPLYFDHHQGDEHRWVVPPYIRFRSPRVQSDVFLPLVYSFRGLTDDGGRFATTIVPPFWHRVVVGPERAHEANYGLFPLFSYGESFNRQGRLQAEHLVIPPLLTYHRWWPGGQTTFAGPFGYVRNGSTTDWGLFPFVFSHSDPQTQWTIIPPLLTYRRVSIEENKVFTLIGPYFSDVGPNSASYNFAPVFFHYHDRTTSRTTFLPLFHTESGPNRFSFITPLGGYARDADGTTVVLPFYQRHRGLTEWDSVLPIFFSSRNPRRGEHTFGVMPFFAHSSSPTGYAWGTALVGRAEEYGRYSTVFSPLFVYSDIRERNAKLVWVFPTAHYETSPESTLFNLYPIFYHAHGKDWHHNVLFPLIWDIGNSTTGSQITVVAPFYARVATRASQTSWAFPNVFWWDSRSGDQTSWGFDVSPFVQYREPRRGDVSWSIFYGLIGYSKQGTYEQLRLFYAPITLRGQPSGSGSAPASTAEENESNRPRPIIADDGTRMPQEF